MSTRPRFKFPCTTEQSVAILTAAYKAVVEYRHRDFIEDEFVTANILRLAQFLTADDAKFGVMMCGVCGNGKTTLLYGLQSAINWMADQNAFEGEERKGIRIVDAREVAHAAKDYKTFQNLKSADMLALEDVGTEAAEVLDYGNILNPVMDLLEYRYNHQLFTAITTNLTPKEIRSRYGDRIADRFNEMLEVIVFENKSYRK